MSTILNHSSKLACGITGMTFIMMNIRDCFSIVRVYTKRGMKNEMPKGKSILALKRLAGTLIVVLIYLGMIRYTGVIVTSGVTAFTKISLIGPGQRLIALANIVWKAILRSPSEGYDITLSNL